MHPKGCSEDLAWSRKRTLNPLWVHWYSLIACMGSDVSGRAHSGMFSGTIHDLKESA